jgi:SAM-dependent methyltransferase
VGNLTFYSETQMGDWDLPMEVAEKQVQLVPDSFRPTTGKLLSIGSGAGAEARKIADCLGIRDVICMDISTTALNSARKTNQIPILSDAEGHSIALRDSCVDIVILNEVIEHLVDTDSILDEVNRVLIRGGILLLSTPNLGAWFNRIALAVGVQPAFTETSTRRVFGRPGNSVVGHLRIFTSRALIEQLEAHRFHSIEMRGVRAPFFSGLMLRIDKAIARRYQVAAGLIVACNTEK